MILPNLWEHSEVLTIYKQYFVTWMFLGFVANFGTGLS